ncbi:MAG: hypothetical protein ACLR0U_32135 [Enterocloster clostridioformis]
MGRTAPFPVMAMILHLPGQVQHIISREIIKRAVKIMRYEYDELLSVTMSAFTEQIDHIIANHARDITLPPETVSYQQRQLLYDVEEGAPGPLLLDIEMPEKDGCAWPHPLRRHLPMAPIIFITSPHPVRGKGI